MTVFSNNHVPLKPTSCGPYGVAHLQLLLHHTPLETPVVSGTLVIMGKSNHAALLSWSVRLTCISERSKPHRTKATRLAFLQLPTEIRIMIYQYMFTSDLVVAANCVAPLEKSVEVRRFRGVALFRTCSQVHQEATSVLYGQNYFSFDDQAFSQTRPDVRRLLGGTFIPDCQLTDMVAFLRKIGKTNRRNIRHVMLYFYTDLFSTFPYDIDPQSFGPEDLFGGAAITVDALRYLSKKCQIETLSLRFMGLYKGITSFTIWFAGGARQSKALSKFRTLKQLECQVGDGAESLPRESNTNGWMAVRSSKGEYLVWDQEVNYESAKLRYYEIKQKLEAPRCHSSKQRLLPSSGSVAET